MTGAFPCLPRFAAKAYLLCKKAKHPRQGIFLCRGYVLVEVQEVFCSMHKRSRMFKRSLSRRGLFWLLILAAGIPLVLLAAFSTFQL